MTTPDFADWIRPVASPEQDTELAVFSVNTHGTWSQTVNCSQGQTLNVTVAPRVTATGAQYVSVEWQDAGGNTLDVESFSTWGNADLGTVSAVPTYFRTQIKGYFARVVVLNLAQVTTDVGVSMSSRPIASPTIRTSLFEGGRILLDNGSPSLAAGSSAVYRISPVSDRIHFRTGSNQAVVTFDLRAYSQYASTPTSEQLGHWTGGTNPAFVYDLRVPFSALEFTITNGDTIARNPGLVVWDAS